MLLHSEPTQTLTHTSTTTYTTTTTTTTTTTELCISVLYYDKGKGDIPTRGVGNVPISLSMAVEPVGG